MTTTPMTSLERVICTLGHKEPDRVPFFLLLTMHGAKELGLTLKEYFSQSKNVVEGQLRLRGKYHHDCYYPLFYAGIEVEAWGGEVIFSDDGPPNSGEPIIKKSSQIDTLLPPSISGNLPLLKILDTIKKLKNKVGKEAPIIGVALSPFSLPVMQMGFDKYFDLMIEESVRFERLMTLNESFCINWANAQLEAGATAICYFDPVSSSTVVTPEMYSDTGFKIAQRVIGKIKGPTATHFASGKCLKIIDKVAETGTAIIGISVEEDAAEIKKKSQNRLTILGNLNGIEMCQWTPKQAELKVKELIQQVGSGGGFILSDNHGEIPFQVTEEVLLAISESVHQWGKYPLR